MMLRHWMTPGYPAELTRWASLLLSLALCHSGEVRGQDAGSSLADAVRFYASFDRSADADIARGDRRAHTATDVSRAESSPGLSIDSVRIDNEGRWGKSLRFERRSSQVVFYRGAGNVPLDPDGFSGTISLWMSLAPDQDLEPGYVDPLQITDKTWNDASLFLDFTKDDQPRHFRLGVFSDFSVWNPTNRPWDQVPAAERPLVDVSQPPFAGDRWTHVAITWEKFNTDEAATAALYLNGRKQGQLVGRQRLTWDPERLVIMLGIYYTGRLDDVAIFDRALTAGELERLGGDQSLGQLIGSP